MRVLTLDSKNRVISVKRVLNNYLLNENEVESDTGELGQVLQEDGTFTTPEPEAVEPIETLEEKIERLEQQMQEDNIIIFEVLATIYEEILIGGN